MPEIIVIIPLYNGEKYIANTLDAVAAQSYKDLEVVICDDGSTDSSASKVKTYQQAHHGMKIVYIFQENKGLGGARNTAMRAASGRIFSLLDQDDIWYPGKLERTKQAFDSNPEFSLVCHNEDILKNGKKAGKSSYGPASADMFRQLLFKGNCLSTSATSFRRQVFEEIGPFSEDVASMHFVEDYDYWLRAAKAGKKFGFIVEPLGCYVLHEKNYSTNNEEMMFDHEMNVIRANAGRYTGKKSWDDFRLIKRKALLHLRYSKIFLRRGDYRLFAKYLFGAPGSLLGLPNKRKCEHGNKK